MKIEEIIAKNITENKFIYAIFTTPRKKLDNPYKKVTSKPITIKTEPMIQFENFTDTKAYHENMSRTDAVKRFISLVYNEYRNANIFTEQADYQIIVSKKGNIKIVEKGPTKIMGDTEHNKKKQYVIREDTPCDFLIELGVMNERGKVLAQKYDKFRQINKFLEIVEDIFEEEKLKENFTIIDFGCGKAYLTFALYYYFYNIKHVKVKIIGLDLKEDVIDFCNKTAQKLNYSNLSFQIGDIRDFSYDLSVDMVVTLHACDNATDAALVKAVKWNAGTILSVPCCQHEFYDKIGNQDLMPMLKHGLIKERISSLVTDTLRSLYLEKRSYKINLLEFISMEHTPKNILIRAVKTKKDTQQSQREYDEFKKVWNLHDLFIEEYESIQ